MNNFEKDLINRYKNMILSSKLQNYTLEDNSTTAFEYFTGKKANKIKGDYYLLIYELMRHFFGNKLLLPIDFIIKHKKLLKSEFPYCNGYTGGSIYRYIPLFKYIKWLEKELKHNHIIMIKYYPPTFFSRCYKNVYYNTETQSYETIYVLDKKEQMKLDKFKSLFGNNKKYYDKQDLSLYDKLYEMVKNDY